MLYYTYTKKRQKYQQKKKVLEKEYWNELHAKCLCSLIEATIPLALAILIYNMHLNVLIAPFEVHN
jgi:hypothetical protein